MRLFGERPVFLYVGRIAVEKNIKAFLDLDLPGRKVLVGSGPAGAQSSRGAIRRRCSPGHAKARSWPQAYASADVFVFPSLTDTFGLVLLEALACGVPVAAFPVSGPKDVLTDPDAGVLRLGSAGGRACGARCSTASAARAHALRYSWENSARQFIENMLLAHNLGLPPRRARFRRWRRQVAAKENGPVGGEPGRFTLMRQFGGRFGGNRVRLEMVSGLARFKRAI